jgi:F-type H+-transporting ATPase subunit b
MLASGAGTPSLTDINFGLVLWTLILFTLFAFVLGKFGWRPMLKMLEEREQSIRQAIDGARTASDEAQALLAQRTEAMREAAREREAMLKRAMSEAEQASQQIIEKARRESEALVGRAKEQITREKDQALLELRAQVAELAMGAAERIVTASLTPEAQKKLVEEFLTALPRQ